MNTRLLPGARLLTAWRSWTSERGLSANAVERARDDGARPGRQRVAFAIVALALLPVLLVMSRDFGVTWDEANRQANGERIWALYHGIPQAEKGYLYGGLFDVSAVALQHVLPLDKYLVRHLLNAFVGWLGIVGCGALAWRVAGPAVGSLAMLILALMPPYTGHAMNNPKDVPFAAAATWALVAIAALPRERPYLQLRHVIALGACIGLALAIRPGGLLFVAYASLWVLTSLVASRERSVRHIALAGLGLIGTTVIAALVAMPVWPFLWKHPGIGMFEALEGVSHHEWRGTVLFNGRDIRSTAMPWSYVPVWLFWTTPPVVIVGAALSLIPLMSSALQRLPQAFAVARADSCRPAAGESRALVAGLWFAVIFPVVYVVARHSTLYDGVRHLLFIVPPLVVLAAVGWISAIAATAGLWRAAVALLLMAGLAEPLVFQVQNHPNQVAYFQPLVGGPRAAYMRFEMDYWGNCLYEAVKQTADVARAASAPITISGRREHQLRLNAARVHDVVISGSNDRSHELEVVLLRGTRRELRAFSRRSDILWYVTMSDGAALCAVTQGPQFQRLRDRLAQRDALSALSIHRETTP